MHTIEEAITDLKLGKPIIISDDENRENEGDFLALSDRITDDVINFMITHGKVWSVHRLKKALQKN